MTNILLCTLGESWAVIPEVYGFLAPDQLPLYANHPQDNQFRAQIAEYGLAPPDELWICTTQGERTENSLQQVRDWCDELDAAPYLRVWQAEGAEDLASADECAHMQELIVRVVLLAHESARTGQVVLSLAGGRKTMSADMQWAGSVFGCAALLHVIASKIPNYLRQPDPKKLTEPLPQKDPEVTTDEPCVGTIMPLIVGRGTRSELLDVDLDGLGAVTAARFPVPKPDSSELCAWARPTESLAAELRERERQGSQLLGNYLESVSREEAHENWRSLYRLPPRIIEYLRKTSITTAFRDAITAWPKADLHRHLGGCLSLDAQIAVGRAVWANLAPNERDSALSALQPWLSEKWPGDWVNRLKRAEAQRPHWTAALLVHTPPESLDAYLYAGTHPRVALKTRPPDGFAAYERPGELSGSALLSHPAAIEPYAEAVVRQAIDEGLAYVELRGSPQKYGNDRLRFLKELDSALQSAAKRYPEADRPVIRFNVIVDRRDRDQVANVVKLAVAAKERWPALIGGLDLAGDEGTREPEDLVKDFRPAFEECLPITIHAGEGEAVESIWQAAYHLHADRIGHGLSVLDDDKLATRFRDRGICLELCPTSNREVVGFRDPAEPASAEYRPYPLSALWREQMPLVVCTDNPGISRTSLTDELLAAARMSNDELTLWDALAMLRYSFEHAFLGADEKRALLKRVDARLFKLIYEMDARWVTKDG